MALFRKRSNPQLKQTEDVAKLKRPSQTVFAEETGTSVPFIAPGTRRASSPAPVASSRSTYQPVEPTEIPPFELPVKPGNQRPGQDIFSFLQQVNKNIPQPMGSSPEGGIIFSDGITRYQDGSILSEQGQRIYPMGSAGNGLELYSDGSIRQGGLSGLINTIFGQDRTITQPYGNINLIEPTAGNVNLGTDIRTRDLTGTQRDIKLPFNTQVVQVFQDDGTRFGDVSGHQGYGNSVLVRLPSGEMLRFSHLSNLANLQPGQTLEAGTVIGQPGTTGNTYGEHLDLEYYNAEGKIDNPNNFQGTAVTPGKLAQPSQNQGQVLGTSATQPGRETPQRPQSAQNLPASTQIPETIKPNPTSNLKTTTANVIDYAKPTGNIDFGISEGLRGDTAGAREKQTQTIENVGTFFKAPELQTGELARSQGTDPFRQALGNVTDYLSQSIKKLGVNLPEKGISEAIAGGATTFTNAFKPQQAYASEGSVLGVNSEIPQAGQGLQSTQLPGISSSRPGMGEVSSRRAIGDVAGGQNSLISGGSVAQPTAETPQIQSAKVNDIRDPFFKAGSDKQFQSFIQNPEDASRGALTLGLFSPEFYKSPERIGTAFKGTSLFSPANEKYTQALEGIKSEFRSKYGEGYDQGDVERLLSSIQGMDLSKVSLPEPKKVVDYGYTGNAPSSSNPSGSYTPRQAANIGSTTGLGVSSIQYPSRTVNAPTGTTLRADSGGEVQAVGRNAEPVKTPSAQLAVQPSGNIFSNLFSSIKNLFRR